MVWRIPECRYYYRITNESGTVGLAFEGTIGGGSGEVALAVLSEFREPGH